jgi:hypothetical protein
LRAEAKEKTELRKKQATSKTRLAGDDDNGGLSAMSTVQ